MAESFFLHYNNEKKHDNRENGGGAYSAFKSEFFLRNIYERESGKRDLKAFCKIRNRAAHPSSEGTADIAEECQNTEAIAVFQR